MNEMNRVVKGKKKFEVDVGRGKVGRLLENLTETCHKKRHGSWQRKSCWLSFASLGVYGDLEFIY